MANIEAVRTCYAVLVDPFGSTAGRDTPHRGADYRVGAGQPVVAYEKCTVVNSDLKSSFLGYSVVAKRHRDGAFIGWAHLVVGTRPNNGQVLEAGDQVGICAGFGDYHGSSWTGPHSHTTEGTTSEHIYQGQNSDPNPDIQAAKAGVAGGGTTPVPTVKYDWYQLSKAAQLAVQQMLTVAKLYDGDEDGIFGPKSVLGLQEWFKRNGYLPADYEVDGIPHNPDQEAPSNYGYACQKWAKVYGYDGLEDGLPAGYTSEFMVKAANAEKAKMQGGTTPPPVVQPPVVLVPTLPMVPAGFFFFPDLGTTQGMFDFAEFKVAGGRKVGLKFGGANASDSPYIAPAYKDQLDRARKQSLEILHYFFNGAKNGLTPEACADFMALHAEIKPGDVVAIDCEVETATGTAAWTVDECRRFIVQLRKHFPGIKGLIYASDSVFDALDWNPVKALGWEAWNASWGANNGDPGIPPVSDEYTEFFAWQYTSKEKVPGNFSGSPRVYGDTDGNMGRNDLFEKLAWQLPPVVDPDPETPADAVKSLGEYFTKAAALNAEYAGVFGTLAQ